MLKQIILLFNLISMSFATIFLADGIEIESNLPNQLVKDSTCIVEVVINKRDLFGFAKFQQNFPEGFDVKPVETSEASFTFADGRMKFIWMALPEKEEVKISYAVTVMEGAPIESIVDGKFSYIQDNERKSYDIPNQTITIISDEGEEEKLPAMASAARIVKHLGGNTYQVDLTISKQGVYGFAKLEEFLPIGAEAEVMDNEKSVFNQVDEKAKFVWMSIPDDADLMISYQVKASSDILSQLQSMEGNLAFLDGNETKTVPVLVLEVGGPAAMAAFSEEAAEEVVPMGESIEEDNSEELSNIAPVEKPGELNETELETAEEPEIEVAEIEEIPEEIVEEVKEPVRIADDSTEPITPVIAIPDPQTGIIYRVQIAAGKKLVPNAQIKKTYAFKEEFFIENHEGWFKYITSQFDVYESARNKRENLVAANHKFPGPFVTAYNAGERITVQEALMISNQKWFK